MTRDVGRGAFATRDIRKGELIHAGLANYAIFRDGPSYRRFLGALSDEEACDVLLWTWTQEVGGVPTILLVLDDNSLQNSGTHKTGCPPERAPCGPFEEYALRDIKEGEELVCDYGEFAESLWGEFGL